MLHVIHTSQLTDRLAKVSIIWKCVDAVTRGTGDVITRPIYGALLTRPETQILTLTLVFSTIQIAHCAIENHNIIKLHYFS